MKILFVGNGAPQGSNESLTNAFRSLGAEVLFFDEDGRYQKLLPFKKLPLIRKIAHRVCWKIFSKPVRTSLIDTAKKFQPDLLFMWKGYFISPNAIRVVKIILPSTKVFCL